MDKSKLVFHSIALITLGAVFLFFWSLIEKRDSVGPAAAPFPKLFGYLYLLIPVSLLAILLGVVCAFYVEERLTETSWLRRFIESEVAIFTGIPSLLYGLLAVEVFIACALGGLENSVGMLFYAEVLTFIFLVMPLSIRTTQAALRSVATPIRESAYVLGANQWQVLFNRVVPLAFPAIFAGGCRAMSRALATVALLIGIHTWGYTPNATLSAGIHSRFVLLLVAALLFSVLSSFLMEKSALLQYRK